MTDIVEQTARIIYDSFPFDGDSIHAQKPDWTPGGNSLMQDRARRAAETVLAISPDNWLRAAAEHVVKSWEHAHIGNEPMIDALVDLRAALSALTLLQDGSDG